MFVCPKKDVPKRSKTFFIPKWMPSVCVCVGLSLVKSCVCRRAASHCDLCAFDTSVCFGLSNQKFLVVSTFPPFVTAAQWTTKSSFSSSERSKSLKTTSSLPSNSFWSLPVRRQATTSFLRTFAMDTSGKSNRPIRSQVIRPCCLPKDHIPTRRSIVASPSVKRPPLHRFTRTRGRHRTTVRLSPPETPNSVDLTGPTTLSTDRIRQTNRQNIFLSLVRWTKCTRPCRDIEFIFKVVWN